MRYSHRAENERQPEVVSDDVVQRKLSRAELRTAALFEAERFLRQVAESESSRNRKEVREIMAHFPSRFELMQLAEHHPMLDAGMAQRLVSRADHLPVDEPNARRGGDATDADSPTPPT